MITREEPLQNALIASEEMGIYRILLKVSDVLQPVIKGDTKALHRINDRSVRTVVVSKGKPKARGSTWPFSLSPHALPSTP